MDIDGEEPPMLVEVGADEKTNPSEEPKPIKVPITLVTGKSYRRMSGVVFDNVSRLSRSGQDNINELHS